MSRYKVSEYTYESPSHHHCTTKLKKPKITLDAERRTFHCDTYGIATLADANFFLSIFFSIMSVNGEEVPISFHE
jgi:hypothetical protein